MCEQFMGDYTYRDSVNFPSNQPSLYLLYFSTYSGIKNYLPYPKHMLRLTYELTIK